MAVREGTLWQMRGILTCFFMHRGECGGEEGVACRGAGLHTPGHARSRCCPACLPAGGTYETWCALVPVAYKHAMHLVIMMTMNGTRLLPLV